MLKKVMILVTVLVLVLTTAQLAQANQTTDPTRSINATQQDMGGTHINTAGQTTAPDPTQQDASQNQQPAGGGAGNQSPLPNLDGLMHLSDRNSLVIDCAAVSERLVHFNQLGNMQMSDPQSQTELARVKDLSQLCADGGYNSLNSGNGMSSQPNSNSTSTTQPTSSTQPASNTGSQPQSNTTSQQTRDSTTLGG